MWLEKRPMFPVETLPQGQIPLAAEKALVHGARPDPVVEQWLLELLATEAALDDRRPEVHLLVGLTRLVESTDLLPDAAAEHGRDVVGAAGEVIHEVARRGCPDVLQRPDASLSARHERQAG